eukprot:TRINITY_DN3941_c0_g1_i6.p1 TRINITY_DN3941_c0_g1~~TRINITY_DN3941_c0_g1_i6.p1  ORF type:complete len:369 (-),score=81.47 TRINITY_DN3941_c0_g1_i6:283-1389(-)
MLRRGLGGLDAFRSLLVKSNDGIWRWQDCLGSDEYDLMQNVEFRNDQPITREIDDILVEDIFNLKLPQNAPLWRLFVYENLQRQSLLVFKFHHAIADGPGLSQVFGRMVDASEESELEVAHANRRRLLSMETKKSQKKTLWQIITSWLYTICCVVACILKSSSYALLRHNKGGRKEWIFDRGENDNKFPTRKIVRTVPVSTDAINALRKKFGGTLNDIILGLLAGTLRRYALEVPKGAGNKFQDVVPPVYTNVVGNTRYLVPGSGKAPFLDNFNAAFVIQLPADIDNPRIRFQKVKSAMDLGKAGYETLSGHYLLELLKLFMPKWLLARFLEYVISGVTLLVSNVRGPSGVTTVCGHEIGKPLLSFFQ